MIKERVFKLNAMPIEVLITAAFKIDMQICSLHFKL